LTTLVVPSLWAFFFLGTFGAAQIRITNIALAEGVGFKPNAWGNHSVRLYAFATEDVLFEHLSMYGGQDWYNFFCGLTLATIILYFITTSDSGSFVVDMLANNGLAEGPPIQRAFWGLLEGATAIVLLLVADEDDPKGTLDALKPIPIILGLPFTFYLFYCCQALVILCMEESNQIPKDRNNFVVFNLNLEPMSFVSFVAPFFPMYQIAQKVGNKDASGEWQPLAGLGSFLYLGFFAGMWILMLAFVVAGIIDTPNIPSRFDYFPTKPVDKDGDVIVAILISPFYKMAWAMFVMYGCCLAVLRAKARDKLKITGDFISDVMTSVVLLPFTVGQLCAEELETPGKDPPLSQGPGNEAAAEEKQEKQQIEL